MLQSEVRQRLDLALFLFDMMSVGAADLARMAGCRIGKFDPHLQRTRERLSSGGVSLFRRATIFQGMDPDMKKLARDASAMLVLMVMAPAVYLLLAEIFVARGVGGLARDPNIIPTLFAVLVVVSIGNLIVTILLQKRKFAFSESTPYLSLHRVYQNTSLNAVLSEAHSIFGLVITLLSGSILYAIGFSLVTWASLIWVRSRFKQYLKLIPNS